MPFGKSSRGTVDPAVQMSENMTVTAAGRDERRGQQPTITGINLGYEYDYGDQVCTVYRRRFIKVIEDAPSHARTSRWSLEDSSMVIRAAPC